MNTLKYLIKTQHNKTYLLFIMDTTELHPNKYIALFLYYDSNDFTNPEEMWVNIRHRIIFENSIEAIKDKVIEYTEGRNERVVFLDMQGIPVN